MLGGTETASFRSHAHEAQVWSSRCRDQATTTALPEFSQKTTMAWTLARQSDTPLDEAQHPALHAHYERRHHALPLPHLPHLGQVTARIKFKYRFRVSGA